MRSSFGVMTASPGLSLASKHQPCGRSVSGTEPETGPALLHRIALDDPLLRAEALALIGLAVGTHSEVPVNHVRTVLLS